MKFLFVLLILTLTCFAHSKIDNIFGKIWVSLSDDTFIQNGKLFELKKTSGGMDDKVQIKDFDGTLIKEVKANSNIDYFYPLKGASEGFVYMSKNKLYHYDLIKNQEKLIQKKKQYRQICDSDNSSILISCESEGEKFAYDLKTQKKIELPNVKGSKVRGQLLVFPEESPELMGLSSSNTISLFDFSTSKKVSFEVSNYKEIKISSEKHVRVIGGANGSYKTTHLINIDGKWIRLTDSTNKNLSGVLSTGELLFLNFKHISGKNIEINNDNFNEFEITTDIYDKTGTYKVNSIKGYYSPNPSSGKTITKIEIPYKLSAFSESSFKELASGKSRNPIASSFKGMPESESGNWILHIDSSNDETNLVNINNRKSFKLPYMRTGIIKEGENGINVLINAAEGGSYVVNTVSGHIRYFESGVAIKFDKNLMNWYQLRESYESIKKICFPDTVKIINNKSDCLNQNSNKVQFLNSNNVKHINEVVLTSLCQSNEFNKKEWDRITPTITDGEITYQQARLYLMRFQKIQGYNSINHLPILSAILKSDIVEESPALVIETLKSLSTTQSNLVRSIYHIFKIDERIPSQYPKDETIVCRSTSDRSYIDEKVQMFKNKVSISNFKTTVEDWIPYKPFKDEFQKISVKERKALAYALSESLAQNAILSKDLNGIFESKIHYFSKKFVLELMGDSIKPTTDITIAMRNGKHIPVILGYGNLSDASRSKMEDTVESFTPFGFSYKILEPINIVEEKKTGDVFKKKYYWKFNGDQFLADTNISVLEVADLIPKEISPNYSVLKKDGKLTGMMIIGSSLNHERGAIVDEYKTYYINAGFKFDQSKTDDVIAFFKNKVESGELDYLIKEAHSDGDERNLFRSYKNGNIFVGTLFKEDGLKEVIYLIAADSEKTDDTLISNQEFGSWIRAREKPQPLLYLNASCNSIRKVISEIAAAHSSNFIPFPSITGTDMFDHTETNGTRQIIQSIRDSKNYNEIRSNLYKSQTFKKGGDHYLFPDEPDYEDVRKNLKNNLDIHIKVFDNENKEVFIHENIEHY